MLRANKYLVHRLKQRFLTGAAVVAASICCSPNAHCQLPAKIPVSNAGASSPAAFPLSSKVSRTVQRVTGINFLTGIVTSEVAKVVLERKLGGKVKVKVSTYSLTDLVAGKIKSVRIKTDGSTAIGKIPLGPVLISSNNPIWLNYRLHKGRKPGLNLPLTMSVRAELDEQHLGDALASETLAKSLRGLKMDLPGLGEQQLQVLEPHVQLTADAIKLDAILITKGASPDTGVSLQIVAKPVLQGSKIVLADMQVSSPDIEDPSAFSKFAEELFNPIVDFARFDRADHAFRLTSFELQSGKVIGTGSLLLAPKQLAQTIPISGPISGRISGQISGQNSGRRSKLY